MAGLWERIQTNVAELALARDRLEELLAERERLAVAWRLAVCGKAANELEARELDAKS